jgi:hypothetical protein
MLSALDNAAEQGLVTDLSRKLDYLELSTSFCVSSECKRVIEDMKRRDRARKQAHDESAHAPGPPEE